MSGFYEVIFLVNATKTQVTRKFSSPYLARKFVNKLRYSKRCTLVVYPISD